MDENCSLVGNQSFPKFYKVLELYSGIGGVHCAFHVAGIPHEIIGAVDVNTAVNEIYSFNFRRTHLMQRNIMSITTKEMEALQPDVITMCPPCQPFTRVGLKQDSQDPRSESFLHLLNVIAQLQRKPSYIFMENVKGFECSDVRDILIDMLQKSEYNCQEFLLTPSQIGIPNSRLRYYLLAKLKPMSFPFTLTEEVQNVWPSTDIDLKMHVPTSFQGKCSFHSQGNEILPLHLFLEDGDLSDFKNFMLPDKILLRYATVLDIVNKNQSKSCCFTRAYGHYIQGTGSVLHTNVEHKVTNVYEEVSRISDQTQQLVLLRKLGLRYFTPKEVSNIMCFPGRFCFPSHTSSRHRYKALGNSVNVCVVSCLLQLLLSERQPSL